MASYPEHERYESVKEDWDKIKRFLDWLSLTCDPPVRLGYYEPCGEFYPCDCPIDRLLAVYFGLDPVKLAKEQARAKSKMFLAVRKEKRHEDPPSGW